MPAGTVVALSALPPLSSAGAELPRDTGFPGLGVSLKSKACSSENDCPLSEKQLQFEVAEGRGRGGDRSLRTES